MNSLRRLEYLEMEFQMLTEDLVKEHPFLEGLDDTALKVENVIYVSPSVYTEISDSSPQELKEVLTSITVLDLGNCPYESLQPPKLDWSGHDRSNSI